MFVSVIILYFLDVILCIKLSTCVVLQDILSKTFPDFFKKIKQVEAICLKNYEKCSFFVNMLKITLSGEWNSVKFVCTKEV